MIIQKKMLLLHEINGYGKQLYKKVFRCLE